MYLACQTEPQVQRVDALTKHRTPTVALKSQIVQEYLAGEPLDGLTGRHSLSRNLIRTWVDQYLYPSQGGDPCEAGACNQTAEAAMANPFSRYTGSPVPSFAQ